METIDIVSKLDRFSKINPPSSTFYPFSSWIYPFTISLRSKPQIVEGSHQRESPPGSLCKGLTNPPKAIDQSSPRRPTGTQHPRRPLSMHVRWPIERRRITPAFWRPFRNGWRSSWGRETRTWMGTCWIICCKMLEYRLVKPCQAWNLSKKNHKERIRVSTWSGPPWSPCRPNQPTILAWEDKKVSDWSK